MTLVDDSYRVITGRRRYGTRTRRLFKISVIIAHIKISAGYCFERVTLFYDRSKMLSLFKMLLFLSFDFCAHKMTKYDAIGSRSIRNMYDVGRYVICLLEYALFMFRFLTSYLIFYVHGNTSTNFGNYLSPVNNVLFNIFYKDYYS